MNRIYSFKLQLLFLLTICICISCNGTTNTVLFPKQTFKNYIKLVNNIYLNSWAYNNMEFSSIDSALLYEIAIKNPLDFGTGVYGARVLLGLDFDEAGNSMKLSQNSNNQFAVEDLVIYPNPTSDEITISSSGNLLGARISLIVYNNIGIQVLNKEIVFDTEPKTISLNMLNNGIYFYKIETYNKEFTGKIVIIKK